MSPVASAVAQAVEIPLSKIRPNPKNPGPPITEDLITDMVENLTAEGLLNAIKLMPDPVNPMAKGQSGDPADFNWIILAGERRYRAFLRMKRETIPAILLYPTPAEAVKITRLDNAVRNRGWWADYQSIENLLEADPSLSQRQVGVMLEMDKERVNWAVRLLPLLNPEARALLVRNPYNSNNGNKGISETAAAGLAGLASDPVTPEIQALVQQALAVAINRGMTQAGVKQLVAWVKAGNKPEEFGSKAPVEAVKAPAKIMAPGDQGQAERVGEISTPTRRSTQATSDGLKELVMGVFRGPLARGPQAEGHGLGVPSQDADSHGGIKLGLAFLGGFLASNLKRALGTLTRRWMMHGILALGVVGLLLTHGFSGLFHSKPKPAAVPEKQSAQTVPEPKVQQALPAPQPKTQVSKSRPKREVRAKADPKKTADPVAQVPVVPDNLKTQAQMDSHFALGFARFFFGTTYLDTKTWKDYFKEWVTEGFYPTFMADYFPDSKVSELMDQQLTHRLEPSGDPVLLKIDSTSSQYLVKGTMITMSDRVTVGQVLSKKPVAVKLTLTHETGVKGVVSAVMELKAEEPVEPLLGASEKGPKGADPTAKFVGDAAGEAAKKLLGF
jgi:hypothetical protein